MGPSIASEKTGDDGGDGGGIRDISGPIALGARIRSIFSPTTSPRPGPQFGLPPLLPPPTPAPDSDLNSPNSHPYDLIQPPLSQTKSITRRPLPPPAPPIPSVVVYSGRASGPTTLVVGRSLTDSNNNNHSNAQHYLQHYPTAISTTTPNSGAGAVPPMPFSEPDPTLRSVPGRATPTIVPSTAAMPTMPTFSSPSPTSSDRSSDKSPSPTEAYIPIMHRRGPSAESPLPVLPALDTKTATATVAAATAPVPSKNASAPRLRSPETPDSDADGFTPVTPGSATLKSPRGVRAFDALGIPVLNAGRSILARARSRKASVVDPDREDFDDVTPLTPSPASPFSGPAGARDLEAAGATRKTTRRTLFGIIEGWWDLGLLERGKSLRRRG